MSTKSINFVIATLWSICFIQFVAAIPQWHQARDGRSYLIEAEKKFDFSTATNECYRRGLQLAEIKNADKNAALDILLRSLFAKTPDLWIGARDDGSSRKDRPFYWQKSKQRMVFGNWASGQPDNSQGVEHCVHYYSATNFKWNDIKCDSKLGFICEGRFP
uniref:C-type lectin domain-containing protein n=1 Tax=Stomoxys calcitrans TaxID=35570 RepID=A0A1I8NQT2_STOCA